jgi:hypothetical protein
MIAQRTTLNETFWATGHEPRGANAVARFLFIDGAYKSR